MSSERASGMYASSSCVTPEEQVFHCAEEWNQVRETKLHGCAGFSAGCNPLFLCSVFSPAAFDFIFESGPSIVGSSLTVIHPIRVVDGRTGQTTQKPLDGGAFSVPPCRHYCAENACINSAVHKLHMQILEGSDNAHVEVNRYLVACAVLRGPAPTVSGVQDVNEHPRCKKSTKPKGSSNRACLVWRCDLSVDGCECDDVLLSMTKQPYKQQYRCWKPPMFCSPLTPLQLPIGSCLVTPLQCTVQYNLLPDLGMFFRGILQRRFFTDASRKHWVRNMACMQSVCGIQDAGSKQHTSRSTAESRQQLLLARHKHNWNYIHGICAGLLLDSLPCMKRSKRNNNTGSSSVTVAASTYSFSAVEVMACINVMYGTLLKLYSLGAKTPTFSAKVNIMQRMLELTTEYTTQQQVDFMKMYPCLMRICFMEYSINALTDWLPVERELLFESVFFQHHRDAMQSYSSIVVATCDLFRQDTIFHGLETFAAMNAAASSCIDRCIRVCKFKLFRMPEAIVKGPQVQADHFEPACLESNMRMLECKEIALHFFGGNAKKAENAFTIHSNLKVFALPKCVALQQLDALDKVHSSCSTRFLSAQQLKFCAVCAINARGASGMGSYASSSTNLSANLASSSTAAFSSGKLRLCCQTGSLSCVTCPPGTVVSVNMVGVLLKICSTYYYMCPKCTLVRPWSSDPGNDLCPWLLCCEGMGMKNEPDKFCHCNFLSPSGSSCATPVAVCSVCACKSVVQRCSMLLPNSIDRVMQRVNLCSKHAPPEHMLGMVTSVQQFHTMVGFYCSNTSSHSRRIGGRSRRKFAK